MDSKIGLITFKTAQSISFLLGMAPCQINNIDNSDDCVWKFTSSKIGFAYNIVLITVFSGILAFGVPLMTGAHYPNNSVAIMIIVMALTICGNSFCIAIIIMCTIFQKRIVDMGNHLSNYDQTYGTKFTSVCNSEFNNIKIFFKLLVLVIIWIALIVTSIMASQELFLISSALMLIFFSFFLTQYSLIITVLEDRLKKINSSFLYIIENSTAVPQNLRFCRNILSHHFIIQSFLPIKRARSTVYKISCQICQFNSFPSLLVISFCCCCLVDTVYFLTLTILYSKDFTIDIAAINSLFYSLISAYPLVILCRSVNGYNAEAHKTVEVIYDIIRTGFCSKELEHQLNRFAVELLHKKVRFTACGFFPLDCTLLQSIFGTIVTYLLFLLQFKPTDIL